jgi:hypothetical protein
MKASTRICRPFIKAVDDCEIRKGLHKRFIEHFGLNSDAYEKNFVEGGASIKTRFERMQDGMIKKETL